MRRTSEAWCYVGPGSGSLGEVPHSPTLRTQRRSRPEAPGVEPPGVARRVSGAKKIDGYQSALRGPGASVATKGDLLTECPGCTARRPTPNYRAERMGPSCDCRRRLRPDSQTVPIRNLTQLDRKCPLGRDSGFRNGYRAPAFGAA